MPKDFQKTPKKYTSIELFKSGFMSGVGWSFGVTIGFVIVSTFVVALLNSLGGLPLVGNFVANIVAETQKQLVQRTPLY